MSGNETPGKMPIEDRTDNVRSREDLRRTRSRPINGETGYHDTNILGQKLKQVQDKMGGNCGFDIHQQNEGACQRTCRKYGKNKSFQM